MALSIAQPQLKAQTNPLQQQLVRVLRARHPLIFLHTHEENRVLNSLHNLAADNTQVICWTCTSGLAGCDNAETIDPVAALQEILQQPRAGFFVLKDVTPFMRDPALARALRDAYYAFRQIPGAHLFILSAEFYLPESLRKNVCVIDIPPPTTEDLIELVTAITPGYTKQQLPTDFVHDIALSLKGITLDQAEHVLHSVMSGAKLSKTLLLNEITEAKKSLAADSGFLEYIPNKKELDDVGGLSNLKTWIADRSSIFNQRSVDQGLPIPRGILIMGVSGCGKSLCAKVVANMWKVPLFRLDMNLIFSNMYGNPEAAFHKSLQVIESLAPVVLWIDEIENGLGFTERTNAIQSHIFSAFLTWMQEKPPLVFVAATANHIEILPAELIRKGRFDQVFFVDLPNEKERVELFRIHLKQNGANVDNFNMQSLILETEGWNGAEIEQVISAARIQGHKQQREFNTQDIVQHARMVVPLSRTMKEQIKVLKDWAWDRATPASQGKGTDFSILDGSGRD